MRWLLLAESRDSHLPCPDCNEGMRKLNFPLRPWAKERRHDEDLRPYEGRAVCDSCGKYSHSWIVMS